jgi:hypothetical protein
MVHAAHKRRQLLADGALCCHAICRGVCFPGMSCRQLRSRIRQAARGLWLRRLLAAAVAGSTIEHFAAVRCCCSLWLRRLLAAAAAAVDAAAALAAQHTEEMCGKWHTEELERSIPRSVIFEAYRGGWLVKHTEEGDL